MNTEYMPSAQEMIDFIEKHDLKKRFIAVKTNSEYQTLFNKLSPNFIRSGLNEDDRKKLYRYFLEMLADLQELCHPKTD